MRHQFIDRKSGALKDEAFFGDRIVRLLYGTAREDRSVLLRTLTSPRMSRWLGYLNFDFPLGARVTGARRFMERLGALAAECVDDPATFRTARAVFERRIRYWDCRPMPADPAVVVSPADSRMLHGSLARHDALRIKERFFAYEELLGRDRRRWLATFEDGEFAVFRLTPDKYHWVHAPVDGEVVDHYVIDGGCHSCNPGTLVSDVGPLSKNRREITILETPGGFVAMIEVVALMIGAVEQRCCESRYARPRPVVAGMELRRGAPKALFRPGSSTVVLLFEKGRIRFDDDLVRNVVHPFAHTRFARGLAGERLVETDVDVRESIGRRQT